jgi:hypothetical protein
VAWPSTAGAGTTECCTPSSAGTARDPPSNPFIDAGDLLADRRLPGLLFGPMAYHTAEPPSWATSSSAGHGRLPWPMRRESAMTTAADVGYIEMRIAKVVGLAATERELFWYVVLQEVSGD